MNGQTLSKAFVPLPGGGTAVYSSSGLAYYRHSDWLGSSRFASTPSRTMYSDVAYAPFGETYAQAGTADPNFTGRVSGFVLANPEVKTNSDTSGSSYDFLFRQYGTQGRWPSPDPAGLAAVDSSNPQSWNRYAYVFNNPLALVDPLGFEPQLFCQSWSLSYEGIDLGSGMDCFMYDFSPRQYFLTLTPQQLAGLRPQGQPDKVFSAANDARLAELIKKLQSCQQYSQIGDELAQMVKQGQITTDPKQGDYGWYHPWSDKVTLSADAMQNEPLTPIHEIGHRHQTSNVGAKWWRPLGAFNMQIGAAWGGLDKLWDQYVAGKPLSQGFVENAAQDWAIKIANACGIKP